MAAELHRDSLGAYVITMALSVFDGCHYLGIQHPEAAAMVILLLIGAMNWYGPNQEAMYRDLKDHIVSAFFGMK